MEAQNPNYHKKVLDLVRGRELFGLIDKFTRVGFTIFPTQLLYKIKINGDEAGERVRVFGCCFSNGFRNI